MPVIIPPTWVYALLQKNEYENSNNDDNESNGGGYTYNYNRSSYRIDDYDKSLSPEDYRAAFRGCAFILFYLVLISYAVYIMYEERPSKIYEKELKYGTEQILNAAHNDAVNSADTINIDEYELVSPRAAKLDSARYARKITRFIKRSGTEFLGWEIDYTRRVYVLTVDKKLIAKDTKFLKLSNGYKRAVEQLAVQRRISKQK